VDPTESAPLFSAIKWLYPDFSRNHRGIPATHFFFLNQPIFEFPLLVAPWLSQYWVRRVHDAMFSSPAPEGGYNGDDDQGQLGAFSALMAIGLFDLQGGVGEDPDWEVTAPIFDRVRIDLASGKRLAIQVTRGAPDDGFIQSLNFNGRRLKGVFLSSAELMQGGTLEVSLGAKPVK